MANSITPSFDSPPQIFSRVAESPHNAVCNECGAPLNGAARPKTVTIPCKCGEGVEVDIDTILPRGADVIHRVLEMPDKQDGKEESDFDKLMRAADALNAFTTAPKYCPYIMHVPASAICPSCNSSLVKISLSLITAISR